MLKEQDVLEKEHKIQNRSVLVTYWKKLGAYIW
jgi:hypothetical protein